MPRAALLLVVPVVALVLGPTAARAEDEHPVVKLVKSKVKDPNKPFALWVTFKVLPGKEKEFEATFAPCLVATRKEPGCVSYELNHDPDHPELYVMYEKFKGVDAIKAHLAEKHTQTLLTTVAALTDGGPQVKVYAGPGE